MRKKILFIFALLIIASFIGLFYVNEVVFPTKIKSGIISGIEKTTGKKVVLGSVKFNIFRGIVMHDLLIYDSAGAMVNAKEITASILLFPIFKKNIIVPSITLKGAELFVHRREDGSFNVIDAFLKDSQIKKTGPYRITVSRITIKNGRINFRDDTIKPNFTKQIANLNLDARLSLPDKVKFAIRFELPSPGSSANIEAHGEYSAKAQRLLCDVKAKSFLVSDFSGYLSSANLPIPTGAADGGASVIYKRDILWVDLKAEAKELKLAKEQLKISADSLVNAKIEYQFKDNVWKYSGALDIRNLTATGIDKIERLDNVKGIVQFANDRIWSDRLDVTAFGLPVIAKFTLTGFAKPEVEIEVNSTPALTRMEEILKDRFSINIPADLAGKGRLYLDLTSSYPVSDKVGIEGYLDVAGAVIKGKKNEYALEDVTGRVEFNSNQITWSGLIFRYSNTAYKTTGALTNFNSPGVRLSLASKDLNVNSAFLMQDNVMTFSKLEGRYRGIDFGMSGRLDTKDTAYLPGAFKGFIKMDISALKDIYKESGATIDKFKAAGSLEAQFDISGHIKDLKACSIDTRITSRTFSIYGYKLHNLVLDYAQRSGGAAEVKELRASLYGGTLFAGAKLDILSKGCPFSSNVNIDNLKLELLKADTPFKDKALGGNVMLHFDLQGLMDNTATYNGSGKFKVSEGKLWELNLFRGIGQLLFTSDFSNIVFKEGECDFFVKKNSIYTDELSLKSDQLSLRGPVRIDFDNSVAATLKAEISESILLPQTQKNITTAIEKYSIIRIKGTLKDPKFEVQPNVGAIVKDMASAFLKSMQQ